MERKGENPIRHTSYVIRSTQRTSFGFTLPELLVVIGVISLITAVLLVNWRTGQEVLALERSASQLAQDMRYALELAIRADADIASFEQAGNCTSTSLTGYGVSLSDADSSYTLFAECNGTGGYQAGDDGLVQSRQLEKGIAVSGIYTTESAAAASATFTPPNPTVSIQSSAGSSPALAVAVQHAGDAATGVYSYTRDSGSAGGNSAPRALCDQDSGSNDCPISFAASPSEPNVAYDWTGGNQRSYTKNPQTAQTGQKTVFLNIRGLIQVE